MTWCAAPRSGVFGIVHRMRSLLLMGAVVLTLLAGRPAQAQPVYDELPPGPWYGWQLLATDAVAGTLLFAPVSEQMGPLARGMGMITLLMDAPIIHMAHRNSQAASISLARLPFLLVGRALGGLAGDAICSQTDCAHTAPVLGAIIGVAPLLIYDWVTARRPGRLFYAAAPPVMRPRMTVPRLEGWAPAVALLGTRF
jgi:hypothetical protein